MGAPVKTFVTSVPKSGTYLVRELLETVGVGHSRLHVSERGTYDYSKVSYERGRRDPQSCLTRMSLDESLRRVPDFAVGHLECRPDIMDALSGWRVIFVTRDYPSTVLSYMVYMLETGRCHRSAADKEWVQISDPQEQFLRYITLRGERIARTYHRIAPWSEHVPTFDYNALLANPVAEANRLAAVMHRTITPAQIHAAFQAKTQTKSKRDKGQYWSDEARQTLERCWERTKPV